MDNPKIAKGVLKKYKHFDGSYIFEKSSHWRSNALEKMIKEYNKERENLHKKASCCYTRVFFLQYNTVLLNCEKKFQRLQN